MNTAKKVKFLYDSLSQQTKWYTGISIKRYLQRTIFKRSTLFSNRSIESGRWSAYCHFDQSIAFENLLSKHLINESSTILVHPLLPSSLLQKITQTKAQIITLDIDKATLAFDYELLEDLIRQLRIKNQTPDLIIHYDSNGLYNDIARGLLFCGSLSIPSIVVLSNPHINSEFINCVSNLNLGSMLWVSNSVFLNNHLGQVIDGVTVPNQWYLSFHIEDRVRSIPENHLRESHESYEKLINSYMILLANKNRSKGLNELAYWQFIRFMYLRKKNTLALVESELKAQIEAIKTLAVADVIFDMEEEFATIPEDSNQLSIEDQDLTLRAKAKQLYDFFAQYLQIHPDANIEVPAFYLDRNYLKFTFYTSEKDFWINFLSSQHLAVEQITNEYNSLMSNEKTPTAVFIASYGLTIDIFSMYNKPEVG